MQTAPPIAPKVNEDPPRGFMAFVRAHEQRLFNIYLFIWFALYVGWQTRKTWIEGRMDYVEVAFAVQNFLLVALILIRSPHKAIDRNFFHQLVSLTAYCSGIFFMGHPATGGPAIQSVAKMLVFSANVLGIVTMLNLGLSFGILIARRKIKTGGLYGFVRHPMFATDILLRIGYLAGHFHLSLIALFLASSGCYVWRALLEERFLKHDPDYADYMRRVRYRFIPGIF